jgi:hypothetical protein
LRSGDGCCGLEGIQGLRIDVRDEYVHAIGHSQQVHQCSIEVLVQSLSPSEGNLAPKSIGDAVVWRVVRVEAFGSWLIFLGVECLSPVRVSGKLLSTSCESTLQCHHDEVTSSHGESDSLVTEVTLDLEY